MATKAKRGAGAKAQANARTRASTARVMRSELARLSGLSGRGVTRAAGGDSK